MAEVEPKAENAVQDDQVNLELTSKTKESNTEKSKNEESKNEESKNEESENEESKNEGQQLKLTKLRKCHAVCGVNNILVTLLVSMLSIFHLLFMVVIHSIRGGLSWVFLVLGILSMLEALFFIFRSHRIIFYNVSRDDDELQESRKAAVSPILSLRKWYYSLLGINGKYYLTKLYFFEVLEHINQVIALKDVYLCFLPVECTALVCGVLVCEITINIWVSRNLYSQNLRDSLIFLDICLDLFCIMFPMYWTAFLMNTDDAVKVLVMPTLLLLSKARCLWRVYFRLDTQRIQTYYTSSKTKPSLKKRKSILNLYTNKSKFESQLKHFPKWARYGFMIVNVGFVLFFGSLMFVHLIGKPSDEKCGQVFTSQVWKGCLRPVPFCQNLFVPKCDCALLGIVNYTKTTLPKTFGKMSSLVTFSINTGRLEHLPASIAIDHRKLAGISIFGNRLKDLPKTLGELNYLQVLVVTGNKLTSLPESIGALGYLQTVEVGHNQLASLPLQIGQLKNLRLLDARRNQLTSLPESIGQLKNLKYLFVENNRLTSLPESIGSLEKLVDFHAWSNNITALPDAVGNMKSLESVDLRHNGIDELPGTIYNWHSILYFYITGNKVCENLKLEAGTFDYVEDSFCEKQCAVDCPSFFRGDGVCDDAYGLYDHVKIFGRLGFVAHYDITPKPNSGCNTKSCNYDNGDCKH